MVVPKLRFREFGDEWQESNFKNTAPVRNGYAFKSDEIISCGIPLVKVLNVLQSKVIGGEFVYVCENIKFNDFVLLKNSILITLSGMSSGKVAIIKDNKKYYQNQRIGYFQTNHNNDNYFIFSLVNSSQISNLISSIKTRGAQRNISNNDINKIIFLKPKLKEQQKIGQFFTKLDQLINLQTDKVNHLKQLKKGYLQKLFTKQGNSIPELRFKGFRDEWKNCTFKDIFSYQQPTKYTVKSDKYLDSGTPVLTANKSFILGYTNEKNTHDENCIIFDDFTLDSKLVKFKFMVKSSAIKILQSKDSVLSFDYELLRNTPLIQEGHARHYISVVQNTKIKIPSIQEQQKIGQLFSTLDHQIELQAAKLTKLKQLKVGYLQKMFI